MKKYFNLLMLCIFAAFSYATAQMQEMLQDFNLNANKKEVSITVISNGCTQKSDFDFVFKKDTLTIFRNKKDFCKAMPEDVVFIYSFAEVKIDPKKPFVLKNKAFAKTENHFLQKTQAISEAEYKVYTDFFKTEKTTLELLPQFFWHAYNCRRVYEKSVINKEKDLSLANLFTSEGENMSTINDDYILKNKDEYQIENNFTIEGMSIITQAYLNEKYKKMGFSRAPSTEVSDIVYLSRVGFNPKKDMAMFYLKHESSPITSYYILMQYKEKKWTIKNVVQDDMIIF